MYIILYSDLVKMIYPTLDELHGRWFHWWEAIRELRRIQAMEYNDSLFEHLKDSSIDWNGLQENERKSIVECMNWANFIKWRSKFRDEDLQDICNSFIKYGKWWRIIDNPDVFGVELTEEYPKWQKPEDAILDLKWADILIREGNSFHNVIYARKKFWNINLSRELLIYWIEHDANFTVMYLDWSLTAFLEAWVLFDKELAYKFIDNWNLNVVSEYMLDEFKKNWFSLDQEFANKLIEISKTEDVKVSLVDLKRHVDEFKKNWVSFNQEIADILMASGNEWVIDDCIEIFKWLNRVTINKLQNRILKKIQEIIEQKENRKGREIPLYLKRELEYLSNNLARINKEYPEWIFFNQENANMLLKEWKDWVIISCIEIFKWLDRETINILQNQIFKRIKGIKKEIRKQKEVPLYLKRELEYLSKDLARINKEYPEYTN